METHDIHGIKDVNFEIGDREKSEELKSFLKGMHGDDAERFFKRAESGEKVRIETPDGHKYNVEHVDGKFSIHTHHS